MPDFRDGDFSSFPFSAPAAPGLAVPNRSGNETHCRGHNPTLLELRRRRRHPPPSPSPLSRVEGARLSHMREAGRPSPSASLPPSPHERTGEAPPRAGQAQRWERLGLCRGRPLPAFSHKLPAPSNYRRPYEARRGGGVWSRSRFPPGTIAFHSRLPNSLQVPSTTPRRFSRMDFVIYSNFCIT